MTGLSKRIAVCIALLALAACSEHEVGSSTNSSARHGKQLIARYGCGSCHVIAGIPSAQGLVGPPLTDIRKRTYIAGILANTPEHLQQWIMHPMGINPKTAMPELGVTENDARDIVAYLYSS